MHALLSQLFGARLRDLALSPPLGLQDRPRHATMEQAPWNPHLLGHRVNEVQRAYFDCSVGELRGHAESYILGELVRRHGHSLEHQQRRAWVSQIRHLRDTLDKWADGHLFFEYAIPRMGKRADVVLVSGGVVYVLEYKVGADRYDLRALDQVLDYALDLKNFHEGSHSSPIVPVLVATKAPASSQSPTWSDDRVALPARANESNLRAVLEQFEPWSHPKISVSQWLSARYKPTPTIVEAAKALYEGHRVDNITRSDAGAINLSRTADVIARAIEDAKATKRKTVCFVTGVPGSGKTLAGLNLATQRMRTDKNEHAVFLSGNGPLVAVLREALVRDHVERARAAGEKITKREAQQQVHAFIQNIHHFRDECLRSTRCPVERVVVFDEAQRAWTREQATRFMREKRQATDFDMSEPDFLLSAMDRHKDWCVVVCLIGGGQEINTGEAGFAEWLRSITENYRHWRVLYSDRISTDEYSWGEESMAALHPLGAEQVSALHLGVNVRSYRAENVSAFVHSMLLGDASQARSIAEKLKHYPFVLTRNLDEARRWLREQARGTERYGLVASANALRLKPMGIHVKAKIDEAQWFLNDKDDVRASYALEDVATEFAIQGLELDWVGLCWDANLRYHDEHWSLHTFRGNGWLDVKHPLRRKYLINTYRVLLTRARQGMIVYVPEGDPRDTTRSPSFYDGTYKFLRECGLSEM